MKVHLITIRKYDADNGAERPVWNKPNRAYVTEAGAKSAYTQICNEYRQHYYQGYVVEISLYSLNTDGQFPTEVAHIIP